MDTAPRIGWKEEQAECGEPATETYGVGGGGVCCRIKKERKIRSYRKFWVKEGGR